MEPTDAMVAALGSDHDTFDLDHDRKLRLIFSPDDINPFEEYGADAYGAITEINRFAGHPERPDGFDGNAEKLWAGQSHQVWWQPPADGPKRGTPEFDDYRHAITDLLTYGMIVVKIELLDGHDAYGYPIVVDVASLGGIEPFPTADYVAELVRDLIGELTS